MLRANELIGLWSADAMYGPGAQADEVFVFKRDGTGFLEIINPVTTSAELFRWSMEAPNRLRLRGYKWLCRAEDDPARVEEHPSTHDETFTIRLQVEQTKAGRAMRVLRFSSQPVHGVSDCYGFCRGDVDNLEPDFSWIDQL